MSYFLMTFWSLTHWPPELFAENTFLPDSLAVFGLNFSQISFNLVENAFATRQLAILATSIAFYDILARACAEIKILKRRKWPTSLGFLIFDFFSPFLFLLFFSFCCSYWPSIGLACSSKTSKTASSRQAIFTMEQPGLVAGNFALSFSLNFFSIFVHKSGSIRSFTLIWASLERCFPPAQVEYRWCQFWSKGMTSEVEERPRLITAGYGRHGSQWVKILFW